MKAAKGATTKGHARRMLAEVERRIMHGQLGIPEPTAEELERRSLTVAQLGERFVAGYTNPKVKNIEAYRRSAKSKLSVRINPRIGTRTLASLDVNDMEALRDELLKELEPASVTLTLAVISKMVNWGLKKKLIDCTNPMKGCVRPAAASSLDYLSKEEVAKLLAHVEGKAPDMHPIIATGLYAGLRKGELLGLRWSDVRLDAAGMDVLRSYTTTPKSGKPRFVPINPELLFILRAWRDRCPATDAGLVFPVRARSGVWGMASEYDMLGLPALLKGARCHLPEKAWHSLRHTFASHFMMSGGNILTLQKLLGHGTLAMTLRYAHLAPEYMAAEVGRMSFALPVAGVVQIATARK
jgi:integrase